MTMRLLTLAMVGLVAHATPHSADQNVADCSTPVFEAWAISHGHHHFLGAERTYRQGVFCNATHKIAQHNAKWKAGESSYYMKLNKYSANTPEEWRQMMGTPGAGHDRPTCPVENIHADVPAAEAVDWRTQGKVTGVKDQGQCGSCWAFSAIGAMESATAIAKGTTWNGSDPNEGYSENQCLVCSHGTMQCQGGFPWLCFQHVHENGGIDSEKDWPYLTEGSCNEAKEKYEKVASVDSCSNVTNGDEPGLQKALSQQPVSVCIAAQCDAFMHYGGGVLDESCGDSENDIDHAVLAVGFDSTAEKPYYIVKNSWGTSWGENGYVRMKIGDNLSCIACEATFPTMSTKPLPAPVPEVQCPDGTYNSQDETSPNTCPKGSTCCCSRKSLFFGKCKDRECCIDGETCKDGHGCKSS